MKIMVVDDEQDMVELVAFNLRAEGYEVVTAKTGQEALRRARTESPDLIVLDLMLPDLDGLSVCERLRRDSRTALTPIVILTAWANEQPRIRGFDLGVDDYMTKPFSPYELARRVDKRLHSRAGLSQP